MIDRQADRPLYRQLADLLRQKINSGQLAPGQELPTVGALARQHDLGRDTVREALAVLQVEGLVVTTRGRAPRVHDPGQTQEITLLPGDRLVVRGTQVVVTRAATGDTETYPAAKLQVRAAQS